jgi:putative transcriptional regulator
MKRARNIGQEILEGIQEIKEWQQGEKKLKVTRLSLPDASDVAKIRQKLNLNQKDFADFMGVSIKTLQNWEQKRREPQGSARSLLRVAEKAPAAVLKALPRSVSHSHQYQGAKVCAKKKVSKQFRNVTFLAK